MANVRVNVLFTEPEYEGLVRLAEQEARPISDQVRYLVARDLRKRKLVPEQVQPGQHEKAPR